jgi:23S rRNA (cytosine1962-C5)-methyltransferase
MASIILKTGRERSLLRRHPWIFANAIAHVEGTPAAGETVDIVSHSGTFLARGAYSPGSQITVRVWTFDVEEPVARALFRARLQRAHAGRRALSGSAGRLVHAECDGLPGTVIDRYGDFLVCQFTAAGAEHFKGEIVEALCELVPSVGIYERSDADVREKEGLAPCTGVLRGQPPPTLLEIAEGPCRFWVDVYHGQKTGFYLDQAANRALVREYCAGAEVLDCFAYTGGFALSALLAGADSAVCVESSADALQLLQRNAEHNGIAAERLELLQADAFQMLRRFRDAGRTFDIVILDPPKFAAARSQVAGAARGYKDINLLAFKLLRPAGVLFTFSCSGLVSAELFQKIVADAALDAGREAQIIRRLTQASDHPVALSFPEGGYLKGLVCRVW